MLDTFVPLGNKVGLDDITGCCDVYDLVACGDALLFIAALGQHCYDKV